MCSNDTDRLCRGEGEPVLWTCSRKNGQLHATNSRPVAERDGGGRIRLAPIGSWLIFSTAYFKVSTQKIAVQIFESY